MNLRWLLSMLACLPLMTAPAAWTAEVHGRSSTQFLWFNNIFNDQKQSELAEYLNLAVTKIDKAGKFSVQGYGRVTQDLQNGEGLNGRLYYLYGDYSGLYDKIDIRLGRQWINYAAASALIDGGQIELRNIGPLALSVMGGRNVIFDLNGEGTRADDFAFGSAVYLVGVKGTDLEVSYFMKFDKDGIARDHIGGSFKQYIFNNLKVYANTRFDFASESFTEVLAGIKFYPTSDLILTGEYYESYPVFDNTSFYSVFAVDRFQEGLVRMDYTINDRIAVNAGYNRQDYGEGADADVFEVGLRLHPVDQVQLNLSYDHRNGYGGRLNGGMAELIYDPIKALQLAAGIHFDVYERDRVTGEETARKYWAGAKYKLAPNMSASVRVEDNVNVRFASDWQGRVVFNYDF